MFRNSRDLAVAATNEGAQFVLPQRRLVARCREAIKNRLRISAIGRGGDRLLFVMLHARRG